MRYQERQVDGREGVSSRLKYYECLALLFGILICLSLPCAADPVDKAVKGRYLVISKLLLGALNDLIANTISVNSKMYIIHVGSYM